jgi:hypothetical protein
MSRTGLVIVLTDVAIDPFQIHGQVFEALLDSRLFAPEHTQPDETDEKEYCYSDRNLK